MESWLGPRMGTGGMATPTAMALFHALEARALASQGDEAGARERSDMLSGGSSCAFP
jgi:hypothetical protein